MPDRLPYDYERLTKWLLKVSYNSARASNAADADLLKLYAPSIVAPGSLPIFCGFSVSLLGNMIEVNFRTKTERVIEIRWARNGPTRLPAAEAAIMSVRMILIHSWRFMIVVMKDGKLKASDTKLVRRFLHGAVLRPNTPAVKVPTVPLAAEGLLHHFADKRAQYKAASLKLRK